MENKTLSVEQAQELYYRTHTCQSDDSDMEESRIERWAEEMGYEITD